MIQRWRCTVCKVKGTARFRKDASVTEAVLAIRDAHSRGPSEYCMADVRLIRAIGQPIPQTRRRPQRAAR
jgi:hypothetical protein